MCSRTRMTGGTMPCDGRFCWLCCRCWGRGKSGRLWRLRRCVLGLDHRVLKRTLPANYRFYAERMWEMLEGKGKRAAVDASGRAACAVGCGERRGMRRAGGKDASGRARVTPGHEGPWPSRACAVVRRMRVIPGHEGPWPSRASAVVCCARVIRGHEGPWPSRASAVVRRMRVIRGHEGPWPSRACALVCCARVIPGHEGPWPSRIHGRRARLAGQRHLVLLSTAGHPPRQALLGRKIGEFGENFCAWPEIWGSLNGVWGNRFTHLTERQHSQSFSTPDSAPSGTCGFDGWGDVGYAGGGSRRRLFFREERRGWRMCGY